MTFNIFDETLFQFLLPSLVEALSLRYCGCVGFCAHSAAQFSAGIVSVKRFLFFREK